MRKDIIQHKQTVTYEWDTDIVLGIMGGTRKGGIFRSPLNFAQWDLQGPGSHT